MKYLKPLLQDQWHFRIARVQPLRTIRTLGEEPKKTETKLDEATVAGRAECLSWDKIGKSVRNHQTGSTKRWDG